MMPCPWQYFRNERTAEMWWARDAADSLDRLPE
jgi:hypothetical protein